MTATDPHYATIWEAIADRIPEQPALRQGSREVSWAEFDQRAARFAGALLAHGIQPHDSVGVYLYNRPEYLEAYFAAFKIRARPFNVNYRYAGEELRGLFAIAEPKVLVFDAELRERVGALVQSVPGIRLLVEVGDHGSGPPVPGALRYEDLINASEPAPRMQRSVDDNYLNFTGGTTGLPKGVLVAIGRSVKSVMFFRDQHFGLSTTLGPVDLAVELSNRGAAPSTIPASPLMHSVAFFYSSLPTLMAGGVVTLLESRSFDPHELLRTIETTHTQLVAIVGDAFAVPLVHALDTGRPEGGRYDTTSLRTICSSGVAWSAKLKGRVLEHIPQVTLVDGSGTTEGITYGVRRVRLGDELSTASFEPAPGLKVLSPDGHALPAGEVGTLASPTHSNGYFGDPERSAATFRHIDGVLHAVPGDLGRIEADGSLTLIGRGVTTINRGGEKIFPAEVEDAIRQLPEVGDCLVLGIPDERLGQSVAALIELEPACTLRVDAVSDAVGASLASYKVPRRVRFVEKIPRAPNGKIDYPAAVALAESAP